MGLMICKELIEANHGTIDVVSDGENLGSRFIFTMRMETTPKPTVEGSRMNVNDSLLDEDSMQDSMRMNKEEMNLLGTIEKVLS